MEYPVRKLHRLKNWDYSQPGYYYVTICTKDKRKLLCKIQQNGLDTDVIPTDIGRLILQNWESIPLHYPNIQTDSFCLMPNHIHGILVITPSGEQGHSLTQAIRGFKSVTTRLYNQLVPETEKTACGTPLFMMRSSAMMPCCLKCENIF